MKLFQNIYKTSAALLAIFALGACQDLLDQESQIYLENTNPITNARSAQSAVIGMYDGLQSDDLYGGSFFIANELTAGNAEAGAFQVVWNELSTGIVPTSNFHVEDMWPAFYKVVNTANTIIQEVPNLLDLGESDKADILGQAYAIRGMVFFDLLRQFGEYDLENSIYGIPLPLEPILSPTKLARKTVKQSYDAILEDLGKAEDLLSYSSKRSIITLGTVEALLARVYLYRGNYDKAFEYADKVIGHNDLYNLLGDYNDIYRQKGNEESIFEIAFSLQDQNYTSVLLLTSPAEVLASPELLARFGRTDSRSALFGEIKGTMRCLKYGSNQDAGDANSIVIRLAEMYTIRAEAYAHDGDLDAAIDDLNILRARAGANLLIKDAFNSKDKVMDAILKEKQLEFAFENGNYWFDLGRMGKLTEIRGLPEFRRIYPVPNRELLADNLLVQNPKY
ncbi:MAG: RagB/SusD family nutrient uptake outer membrane protein [Cyclobacteriaceae bacterium]|nr:RagB/SusD family nutrient uptake outer membrane protein [Cyclobacteriaceae bacterium]